MNEIDECIGENHDYVGAKWTLSTCLNDDDTDGETNMGIYLAINHDLELTYI